MSSAAVDVSPSQWLAIAVFVAVTILASTKIGALWRGEIETVAEPSRQNRSLAAWFVVAWLMILAAGPTVYVLSRNGPVQRWAAWLLLISLTAVAVSMLLACLVWLIGRPRFLVPPRMRANRE